MGGGRVEEGEMLMICKKLQQRTGCIDWLHGWGKMMPAAPKFVCLMEMWAGLWNTKDDCGAPLKIEVCWRVGK
jgi:hypothetical protein